ncbi:MAG: hypothetical protein J1E42_06620 [Akkermansiaceae bacterium]|nr:hypothetical protein [Akkermansiaceae bacterium]
MNKLRKIISNVLDILLAFAWICTMSAEGEDEPEDISIEITPEKKNA